MASDAVWVLSKLGADLEAEVPFLPPNTSPGAPTLDSLPLPALSLIASHLGPRPDALLRCCKATYRLQSDQSSWTLWMITTYGTVDVIHKLRHCKWLKPHKETAVLLAIKALLKAGADPNMNEELTGFWAPSALHWAVCQNYPLVVETLVHAGSRVDENVVCAAAAQGNLHTLKALVEALTPSEFQKCRDYAFLQASSGGEVESAAWLLDHGANVHFNEDQALYEASYHDHLGVVQLLLNRGAEVRARNDSALVAAAFKGHLRVAQLLISKGADPNSQRGRALAQAAGFGHLAMARLLINSGALQIALNEGLVAAARKGFEDIVALVLESGGDANASCGAAFQYAISGNNGDIVTLLIKAGVDARSILDAEAVQQLILEERYVTLAAMELAGAEMGLDLSPGAWDLFSLSTFTRCDFLRLERDRLLLIKNTAYMCSELVVTSHPS